MVVDKLRCGLRLQLFSDETNCASVLTGVLRLKRWLKLCRQSLFMRRLVGELSCSNLSPILAVADGVVNVCH